MHETYSALATLQSSHPESGSLVGLQAYIGLLELVAPVSALYNFGSGVLEYLQVLSFLHQPSCEYTNIHAFCILFLDPLDVHAQSAVMMFRECASENAQAHSYVQHLFFGLQLRDVNSHGAVQ